MKKISKTLIFTIVLCNVYTYANQICITFYSNRGNSRGHDVATKVRQVESYANWMDASLNEKASLFINHLKNKIKPGLRLVDLGAGTGNLGRYFAVNFPDITVTSVELSPDLIKIGKAQQGNQKIPNYLMEHGDITGSYLENKKEKSDIILMNSVLHEVSSFYHINPEIPENATAQRLGEIRRLLKRINQNLNPSGSLIFRDFVRPTNADRKVILKHLKSDQKEGFKFSDFANQFGFFKVPIKILTEPNQDPAYIYYETSLHSVFEYIFRKDHGFDWKAELNENYGFWDEKEMRTLLSEEGFRVTTIENQDPSWFINNFVKNKIEVLEADKTTVIAPHEYVRKVIVNAEKSAISEVRDVINEHIRRQGDLKESSYTFFQNVISSQNAIRIIKEILSSDDLLAAVAKRAIRHPLGFTKFILDNNWSDRFKGVPEWDLRLHVWDSSPGMSDFLSLENVLESLHAHRWNFISTVLTGSIENHKFLFRQPTENEMKLYERIIAKVPHANQKTLEEACGIEELLQIRGSSLIPETVDMTTLIQRRKQLLETLNISESELKFLSSIFEKYENWLDTTNNSPKESYRLAGYLIADAELSDGTNNVTIHKSNSTYFHGRSSAHRLAVDPRVHTATFLLVGPSKQEPGVLRRPFASHGNQEIQRSFMTVDQARETLKKLLISLSPND